MKVLARLAVGLVAVALLATAAQPSHADTQKAPVVVMNPKRGQTVDRIHELHGKVQQRGWPIVMVRSDSPDALWWVQSPIETTTRSAFKARVRFGNAKTKSGSKFLVTVALATTKQQMETYAEGASFKELPDDLPRSVELQVTMQDAAELENLTRTEVIDSPADNGQVRRIHEMTGKVDDGRHPVVLVRAEATGSPWWVQDRPALETSGEFRAKVRFGNDKTPAGAAFRVVVLMAGDAAGAEGFAVGSALKQLPHDVDRSREIRVLLAATEGAE